MSYEEKDWIMRQIKQIAIGLGRILGKDSLKEMINMELSASERMSDEELDDVLLLIEVEEKITLDKLTAEAFETKLKLTQERFEQLLADYSLLKSDERKTLKEYVSARE